MRKRVVILPVLIAIFWGSVNAQSFLGKLVDDKRFCCSANVVLLNPKIPLPAKGR